MHLCTVRWRRCYFDFIAAQSLRHGFSATLSCVHAMHHRQYLQFFKTCFITGGLIGTFSEMASIESTGYVIIIVETKKPSIYTFFGAAAQPFQQPQQIQRPHILPERSLPEYHCVLPTTRQQVPN
jgi:hypothetical protein